jgi:hypothetical protein
MSRRTNILLLRTLAAGVVYGSFGVPLLLPLVSENTKEPVEEHCVTRFPDGLEHNFGKVTRGTFCMHAFRIVNTSRQPLRIVGLRKS